MSINNQLSQKNNKSHENVIYNIDCSEVDYKIDTENEDKKSKKKWPLTRMLTNIKEKLLYSDHNQYRVAKAIFGILVAIFLGTLIYLVLKYSFKHETMTAIYIALACTFLLCVGLSFSIKCRCISSLMIPNLFTQKGRVMYLSMISGLILSGPVTNLITNFQKTGDSMQCSVELVRNLTTQIQEQAQRQFAGTVQTFRDIDQTIKETTEKERGQINKIQTYLSTLEEASNAVQDAAQRCEDTTSDISDTCQKICTDIPLPDGPWNPFNLVAPSSAKQTTYMTKSSDLSNHSSTRINRSRRSVCSSAVDCTVFNSEQVCSPLNSVYDTISNAQTDTREVLNMLKNFFALDVIEVKSTIEAGTNSSKNTSILTQNVRDKIQSTADQILKLIILLNRVLSLTLVLLLIQSVYYWRNYCSKDSFDNIYITRQFKKYDQQQKDCGKESVLPLKKKERHFYVETTSIKMVALEVSDSKLSLGIVTLHLTICIVIVVFDYILYFLLNLINAYGNADIEINAKTEMGVTIQGTGLLALILKGIEDDLVLQSNATFVVNLNECLPFPKEPKNLVILYIFLYVIAFFLVFLQTYGMRLQHKLASYYYPDQEYARTVYLHQHILHKRRSFKAFLKQHVQAMLKNFETQDRIDFMSILKKKITILKKICPKKAICFVCGTQILPEELEKVKVESCPAIYCSECIAEFNGKCSLCDGVHRI